MIDDAPGGRVGHPGRRPVSGALALFRDRWRALVPCALIGVVPVAMLDAVDYLQSGVDPFAGASAVEGRQTTLSWLALGLSLALYSLVNAACVRIVSETLAGRDTDWRSAVSWGAARTIPVLLVTVIVTFGVAVGLLAFVVPGIWLAVAWSVAVPAVVLEGSSPLAAIKRSFGLVRGSWWHALGVILLGLLVALAGLVAVAIPVALLLGSTEAEPGHVVLYAVTESVVMAVLLPFGAALLTLLYFELRARQEERESSPPPPAPGEGSFGGFAPPEPPR